MVADDAVDRAVEQRRPQRLAVGVLADWGAALELGAAVRDVLRGEREVVEARFDGEREPRALGRADERERVRRGEVHDVQPEGRVLLVEGGYQRDGVDFELLRPGGEERRVERGVGIALCGGGCRRVAGLVKLGVEAEDRGRILPRMRVRMTIGVDGAGDGCVP